MTSNKRNIPEIRDRLRELADEHDLEELHDLADENVSKFAGTTRSTTKCSFIC